MLAKLSKRWWWILVVWVISILTVTVVNYNTKPLYTGRTTVIESFDGTQNTYKSRLVKASKMALSKEVITDCSKKLHDLGNTISPDALLKSVNVCRIKNTNILAIEVTLPDPQEAKEATDVLANRLKKAYFETYLTSLKSIDPTEVTPVNQHQSQKLMLTPLLSLLLGIILVICIPARNKPGWENRS